MTGTLRAIALKLKPAQISLALVGLMLVLPFQYYRHNFPLTSFYQEWYAAFLGVCAMLLLQIRDRRHQLEIPKIIIMPLALMPVVFIQYFLGRVEYTSIALLATMYFAWMAILILLAHGLKQEFGLPAVVTTLAAFLLFGSELAAFTGIAQQYEWSNYVFDRVIALKTGRAISGNVAQPNHYADYITLGAISLGLLYVRWRMRIWQVLLLALPLLFVLVLSGSRSPWLFLTVVSVLAYLWQRHDKTCRPLLWYCLLLFVGFGLMNLIVQIPGLTGSSASVTSGERLASEVGGIVNNMQAVSDQASGRSFRLTLWREAWVIFTQYPLFGSGFGSFAWEHFLLASKLKIINAPQAYTNAHNFIFHIGAEMGIAGLLAVLLPLAVWFMRARKAFLTVYHWWLFALLAILLVHSCLEYPLWHAFFLGMAVIALGLLDTGYFRLSWGWAGRGAMLTLLATGLLSMSLMWAGHAKLVVLTTYIPPENLRDDSYEQRMSLRRVQHALLAIPKSEMLFLRPFQEFLLAMGGWNDLADNLALNERIMHYWPSAEIIYKEAISLARLGRYEEARKQMEHAIWAIPARYPGVQKQLQVLAQADSVPDRFPALLAYSNRKYEEWQQAAHH